MYNIEQFVQLMGSKCYLPFSLKNVEDFIWKIIDSYCAIDF